MKMLFHETMFFNVCFGLGVCRKTYENKLLFMKMLVLYKDNYKKSAFS